MQLAMFFPGLLGVYLGVARSAEAEAVVNSRVGAGTVDAGTVNLIPNFPYDVW